MTLGQLRSLLEVSSAGSVRGAAERLFVTQPAVSSQIAALQKELGVRLAARAGRGLPATPPGPVLPGSPRPVPRLPPARRGGGGRARPAQRPPPARPGCSASPAPEPAPPPRSTWPPPASPRPR